MASIKILNSFRSRDLSRPDVLFGISKARHNWFLSQGNIITDLNDDVLARLINQFNPQADMVFRVNDPDLLSGANNGIWSVSSPVDLTGATATDGMISVTALNNGNYMVTFGTESAQDATVLAVYDSDMVQVGSNFEFVAHSWKRTGMATLNNGNVVITFLDRNDSIKPKFIIVSPTGSIIKAATAMGAAQTTDYTWAPRVVALSTGGFLAVWANPVGLHSVAYDAAGNVAAGPVLDAAYNMDRLRFSLTPSPDGALMGYALEGEYSSIIEFGTDATEINSNGDFSGEEGEGQTEVYAVELDNGYTFFAWNNEGTAVFMIRTTINVGTEVAMTNIDNGDIDGSWTRVHGLTKTSDGNVMIHLGDSDLDSWTVVYDQDGVYIEANHLGSGIMSTQQLQTITQLDGGKVLVMVSTTAQPRMYTLTGS